MKRLEAIKSKNMAIEKSLSIPANACYILQPESIERLAPGKWFNDELINCYIQLINHYFISHEYTKMDLIPFESTVLPYLTR
jgi:Ulp1 family protease